MNSLNDQLDKRIKELTEENDKLKKELRNAQADYMNIEESFFWRLTNSLRSVTHWFTSNDKNAAIRFHIDRLEFVNNELTLEGWIFGLYKDIDTITLSIQTKNKKYNLPIRYHIKREDVQGFYPIDAAALSGFFYQGILPTHDTAVLFLTYRIDQKKYTKKLAVLRKQWGKVFVKALTLINAKNIKGIIKLARQGNFYQIKEAFKLKMNGSQFPQVKRRIEYREVQKNIAHSVTTATDNAIKETVDIIIPVYNGIQYFDKLFGSLKKTNVSYRLLIVDDCSPDKSVKKRLENYEATHDNVYLYRNETNLGFVKSVNVGLKHSQNDVVLLNTDVELPQGWLERLITPIIKNRTIATVTPFTNSGTICSFPKFAEDNTVFNKLEVDEIDRFFRPVKPNYIEMPTGVGFCMAMNQEAIREVGFLDEKNFGRGYGEENDWCQRAIKKGFTNVMCENLYVFHNHGGSFLSEEKAKLLKEHERKLSDKHPNYLRDVASFVEKDPDFDLRGYLELCVSQKVYPNEVLFFNHDLGGGANAYLEKERDKAIQENYSFYEVRYELQTDRYIFNYTNKISKLTVSFDSWTQLIDYLSTRRFSLIVINELVTYPELYQKLKDIRKLAQGHQSELRMLMHDFYSVCPCVNLINDRGAFCQLPDVSYCDACLKNNKTKNYLEYETMVSWRSNWFEFLDACTEVRCFSNNTLSYVKQIYPKLTNVSLVPHTVDYLDPFEKKYKTTHALNIGILGTLSVNKGYLVVKDLLDYIDKNQLNINIIHLGDSEKELAGSHYIETGRYLPQEIPNLILRYDIDVFFISSIWPETFSYTTEEAMQLNMPVASFAMGAPAERIRNYSKGIILKNSDPEYIVSVFQKAFDLNASNSLSCPYNAEQIDKRTLFIVKDESYATRYRVDHLMEQYLIQGRPVKKILIDNLHASDIHVGEYHALIIYRCSDTRELSNLIEKFHDSGKNVWFEVDDYIFDYNAVKNLDFVKFSKDTDYEQYCRDMFWLMQKCDGYLTSTNTLKNVIQRYFPEKPVLLHRNVASYEMRTLSRIAFDKHKKQQDPEQKTITLGYFSGSWTHNNDFSLISEALLSILKEYPNVNLLLGGALDIPVELAANYKRIKTFPFSAWTELPEHIASVDINLMPLESSLFHSCKSENKWMEAGLVGVPTIASKTQEICSVVRNDEDGCIIRRDENWKNILEELVNNHDKRAEIGRNVRTRVLTEYTTMKVEPELLDM